MSCLNLSPLQRAHHSVLLISTRLCRFMILPVWNLLWCTLCLNLHSLTANPNHHIVIIILQVWIGCFAYPSAKITDVVSSCGRTRILWRSHRLNLHTTGLNSKSRRFLVPISPIHLLGGHSYGLMILTVPFIRHNRSRVICKNIYLRGCLRLVVPDIVRDPSHVSSD